MLKDDLEFLPHRANIGAKRARSKSRDDGDLLNEVGQKYEAYSANVKEALHAHKDLESAVESLNDYLVYVKQIEKRSAFFNWRSDFGASVLPEFLALAVSAMLQAKKIVPLIGGRNSIVELTLSGARAGGWQIRRKNQDLCIGLRRDAVLIDDTKIEFVVPVCVVEVKTNLDVNKFNGLDFSAERLKSTFPGAAYYIVTETVDFSLRQNYVASHVDEIYVLRKQLRSKARRARNPIKAEVVQSFIHDLLRRFGDEEWADTHVYDRLTQGRLVHA